MQALKGKSKVILIVLCVVCLLGCVGLVLLGNKTMQDGIEMAKANNEKISQLKEQEQGLEDSNEQAEKDIASYKNSAAAAGQDVAKLQNDMSSDTLPTQAAALKETAQQLVQYSGKVDDGYTPVYRPWYATTKTSAGVKWSFESSFSFKEDTLTVVWTCSPGGTDSLEAYAVGTYDAKTNKFDNIRVVTTEYGHTLQSDDGNAEYQKNVDAALDGLEVK